MQNLPRFPRGKGSAAVGIRCKDCVAPAPQDVAPRVLIREPGLLVHFLPDAIFKRPKAFQSRPYLRAGSAGCESPLLS